jgi:predicted GIY-YIG superfamily endonuclease
MTVYLIHFDRPIGDLSNPHGQARHYLGSTDDLEERLKAHAGGNGSKIMAEVARQGIGWKVVRTWPGGRGKEKELKRQKNNPRLCPVCRENRERGSP